MPDTTSPLGFPFPLGTDPLAAGASDIEGLAEGIEGNLLESFAPWADLERLATNQTIISFGLIVFDGGAFSSEFAAGGGGVEYTGPDVWVMIHSQIYKQTATDVTAAYIEINGFSEFRSGPSAAAGFFGFQTSGLRKITSGDTIAFGVAGSSVVSARCRIKSLGLAGV